MRLLPYDRLIVVGGSDSFRSSAFHRLRSFEPGLRAVRVDPFDLGSCLTAIETAVARERTRGPVRISATGGTKILTAAAILAAFHEGVEAWYCDPEPTQLPVLRGVRLTAAFPSSEAFIVRRVRGRTSMDRLVAAMVSTGFARRTALSAVRSLVSKGLLESAIESGQPVVRPSAGLGLIRPHVRPESGKA